MTGIKLRPLLSQALPLIKIEHRRYGDVLYTYSCRGRGSVGWGTTKEQAYQRWVRNYQKRLVRWMDRNSTMLRRDDVKLQHDAIMSRLRRVK